MSEGSEQKQEGSMPGQVLRHLVEGRWTVVAALIAIGLLIRWPGDLRAGVAAVLVVLLGAAFAPRAIMRSKWPLQSSETSGATRSLLSADDLAAAVVDPMVIFDDRGTVLKVNPACAVAFPGVIVGSALSLRFRAPEMLALIDGVVASHRAGSAEYLERVPVERWFRVTVSPAGSDRSVFVMIFRDQSETRRIDRMRADFIANASHELRTPLASVSGFIETLRGPARNDPAARDQFLQIMQSQTERMARLIDDLLSLSRLEMKTFTGPAEQLDLRPLIGNVIDTLKPLAQDNGVVIDPDLGSQPAMVAGTRDELIQVFSNLIENACKYGRSGELVEVSIVSPGAQGGVDVMVKDYGPGIPDEHIPRLTERFYRVDVETSRGQKGTGLGLAIVKHILTRHNARLTIRSKSGEGATFTVHFLATDG